MVGKKTDGFTIIEILIVLAIAGLIILILLLTLPAAKRNQRNYDRKQSVQYVYSQLQTYYSDNTRYPLYEPGECSAKPECEDFLDYLRQNGLSKSYEVTYNDSDAPHEYPFTAGSTEIPEGAYGQVVIMPAHWCNRSPGLKIGDSDFPVYTAGLHDNDFRQLSVYTLLENKIIYCLDTKN